MRKVRASGFVLRHAHDVALELADRADKAVTATGQSLHPGLASGSASEHPPNRGDLHREIALFDDEPWPGRIHDARLLDVLVGMLDQGGQHSDRAWAERHRYSGVK